MDPLLKVLIPCSVYVQVSLLKELRHPRVVLLIGVCTTSKLPMMVLELMTRGSLHKHLQDPDRYYIHLVYGTHLLFYF